MTKRVLVETERQFVKLADLLLRDPEYVAVDTETTGVRPHHGDKVVGASFYFPADDISFYYPIRHAGENRPIDEWYELSDMYPNPSTTYLFFNSKFDLHMLDKEGFRPPYRIEEVMVAAQLLNEEEESFKLKRLSVKYLGDWAGVGEEELTEACHRLGIEFKSTPQEVISQLPADEVALYAMMDTELTWHLREYYRPYLHKWGQWELYHKRSEFVLKALFQMERNGIQIDVEELRRQKDAVEPKIEELKEWFREKSGDPDFNPNSHQQLKVFFRKKYGRRLANTREYTIEGLAGKVEGADKLLEYKQLEQSRKLYYVPYETFLTEDGRIHASFNEIGARTGRLSSYNPNFQQLPKKDGYEVKKIFVPDPGFVLFQADYSMLELRLAAHFARDKAAIKAIREGDVHQHTADEMSKLLGRPVDRPEGKTFNFALLYGMGKRLGAIKFGVSKGEAEKIIEAWHSIYPGFRKAAKCAEKISRLWRDHTGLAEGDFQYFRLENGRTRKFHTFIFPRHRLGWNFLVQGTAAFITEESITRVANELTDGNFKINMTVHDSLVGQVREGMEDQYLPRLKEIMEDWEGYDPPMVVDVQVGRNNLMELEDYE